MFEYEASMGKSLLKTELTCRTATISKAILVNTRFKLGETFKLDVFLSFYVLLTSDSFSPINVSALVLTQAASGLCAAGTWFHEASLLLCEGITRSRAGQAEARVQHGGSANQARKRGEPS